VLVAPPERFDQGSTAFERFATGLHSVGQRNTAGGS
jgi:hypothetical protein